MFLKTNEDTEFYKLPFFLLFNLLRRRLRLKTWKIWSHPPWVYHRHFWSDNRVFLSTLSQLVDLMEKKKGPAWRDKQLYSHARALDVLIATLFKRLYNFQSFLTFFCVGGGGVWRLLWCRKILQGILIQSDENWGNESLWSAFLILRSSLQTFRYNQTYVHTDIQTDKHT